MTHNPPLPGQRATTSGDSFMVTTGWECSWHLTCREQGQRPYEAQTSPAHTQFSGPEVSRAEAGRAPCEGGEVSGAAPRKPGLRTQKPRLCAEKPESGVLRGALFAL